MNFYEKIKKRLLRKKDNIFWGSFGKGSRIIRPMRIMGKSHIFIGNYVTILNHARIEAVLNWGGVFYNSKIEIGAGTSIEQCCHIIAADHLTIGKNCVISAFVYISDCNHIYQPNESIMSALEVSNTKIGDHCFIGIGSYIMPGTTLGKNCVVGANSVVKGNIPDYSMVVGSPAVIVKTFDIDAKKWVKNTC